MSSTILKEFYTNPDLNPYNLKNLDDVLGHNITLIEDKLSIEPSFEEDENSISPDNYKSFYIQLPESPVIIGNLEGSSIKINNPKSIMLTPAEKGSYKLSFDQSAPVYVNGQRAKNLTTVNIFDFIYFEKVYIQLLEDKWHVTFYDKNIEVDFAKLFLTSNQKSHPKHFPDYFRSPRIWEELPTEKVSITSAPDVSNSNRNSILKAVGGSLGSVIGGLLMGMVSGRGMLMVIISMMVAVIGVVASVSSSIAESKKNKEEAAKKEKVYKSYLTTKVSELENLRKQEKRILDYQFPSLKDSYSLIEEQSSRIYERTFSNTDFLEVRLGSAKLKPSYNIDFKFDETNRTELYKAAKDLVAVPYMSSPNLPLTLPIKEQALGIVGSSTYTEGFVQELLLQIATLHSYHDIQFMTIMGEEDYPSWEHLKVLRHYQLSELNMQGMVYNEHTAQLILASFYQLLVKRRQAMNEAGNNEVVFPVHYVLVITADDFLNAHPLQEFLAEDMSQYGVTVVYLKEDKSQLAETVHSIVSVSENRGVLISNNDKLVNTAFKRDSKLSRDDMILMAHDLAALNHLTVIKNAVPDSLSLLEQYEVENIEDLQMSKRWEEAEPNKSIRSLIGWRGKKDYVYWDLHERAHGPHALVGGTTGSGKSEFLTTYLIGLAINFSPEDIGMLVIDWKGGGIANTLADLPHFMGAITNLDGAGTARALASIKAELQKRQREFAKYGVNNINGYMSLYKQRHNPKEDVVYPTKPLPHLVLVSDEFAELKSNVPEFLDELTSVARIGRSLGVHLILATQKPSGVVNDQIEANSTSKIALKMQTPQDSNELLKTPDASYITNPGRGYLKVGQNEVYELFQSGYAGVPYLPGESVEEQADNRIYKLNDLGQKELVWDPEQDVKQAKDTSDADTQLEAVISEIGRLFEQSSYTKPDKPWLPNLEEKITSPELDRTSDRNLNIPLGLMDKPAAQSQEVLYFDFDKQGHTAVYSSPGYGKSTTLQTIVMNLARQNTPEQVQFNLLDFGTNGLLALRDLPHVVDFVNLEQEEKLDKMLALIASEIAKRKKAFQMEDVANIKQYEAKGHRLPINVTIVDAYDGLADDQKVRDKVDLVLNQLIREGQALGMYLVMSANRAMSIRMNMSSNIQTKLVLYMLDKDDLTQLVGAGKLDQSEILGRGQIKLDEVYMTQIYQPTAGDTDAEILEGMKAEIKELDQNWDGVRPAKIPMVSDKLTFDEFETYIDSSYDSKLFLGLSRSTAMVEEFNLHDGKTLGIFTANKKQSVTLRNMLEWQVDKIDGEVILIDALGTLSSLKTDITISKDALLNKSSDVIDALKASINTSHEGKFTIILNGISQIFEKLRITGDDFFNLVEDGNINTQYILIDHMTNVGANYSALTKSVKENIDKLLFNGDLQNQNFVSIGYDLRNKKLKLHEFVSVVDDTIDEIIVPQRGDEND